jgi:hypothetical protein
VFGLRKETTVVLTRIAIVLFLRFYNRANEVGRSPCKWGFLASLTFLVCSGMVSAAILRIALVLWGSSDGDALTAVFVTLLIGNAVGLNAAILLINRSLPLNSGGTTTREYWDWEKLRMTGDGGRNVGRNDKWTNATSL